MTDLRLASDTLSAISGKWTFPVLVELAEGPRSYNELARAIGTDNKTLARALDRLQERNLVRRESCGRQRVRYSLASHARTMNDLLRALACLSETGDRAATSGDPAS